MYRVDAYGRSSTPTAECFRRFLFLNNVQIFHSDYQKEIDNWETALLVSQGVAMEIHPANMFIEIRETSLTTEMAKSCP